MNPATFIQSENPSNSSTQPEDTNTGEVGNQSGTGNVTGAGAGKTAEEEEADRLYEERIEEEYAKREGGA
jgi:hypothetical protein